MTDVHLPVLVNEVLRYLEPHPGGVYIDATFGRGGHTRALLERLDETGRVYGLDRDPEAVAAGRALEAEDQRFVMVAGAFGDVEAIADKLAIAGKVDGMIFDLGVSSPQLSSAERGFSFTHEGPLDMRMDRHTGITAAEWLAGVRMDALATVLREYGEERHARRIARAIVNERERSPLETTGQLAAVIRRAYPGRWGRIDPATRSFLAIRIQVNQELDQLRAALEGLSGVLAVAGRAAFISFHSLEDRIVKRFLRAATRPGPAGGDPRLRLVAAKIRASEAERASNPRARSAIMRVTEKLA